jgi:hypothetical protein
MSQCLGVEMNLSLSRGGEWSATEDGEKTAFKVQVVLGAIDILPRGLGPEKRVRDGHRKQMQRGIGHYNIIGQDVMMTLTIRLFLSPVFNRDITTNTSDIWCSTNTWSSKVSSRTIIGYSKAIVNQRISNIFS